MSKLECDIFFVHRLIWHAGCLLKMPQLKQQRVSWCASIHLWRLMLWTILNLVSYDESRDRKRGWVVHWPLRQVTNSKARQSTTYPTFILHWAVVCYVWVFVVVVDVVCLFVCFCFFVSQNLEKPFFFPVAQQKEIFLEKYFVVFVVTLWIRKSKRYTAVLIRTIIYVLPSTFVMVYPFCRLTRRPASQPRSWSGLPCGPQLMNILKNGPLRTS